jgi:hypothetical protein
MIELILLAPIAFLGYLLWRADRRYDRLQEVFEAERRELLQRIQAPERAVLKDFEPSDRIQYVPFDDDEAWRANQEELNG